MSIAFPVQGGVKLVVQGARIVFARISSSKTGYFWIPSTMAGALHAWALTVGSIWQSQDQVRGFLTLPNRTIIKEKHPGHTSILHILSPRLPAGQDQPVQHWERMQACCWRVLMQTCSLKGPARHSRHVIRRPCGLGTEYAEMNMSCRTQSTSLASISVL